MYSALIVSLLLNHCISAFPLLKGKKKFSSVILGLGLIRMVEEWPTRGPLAQGK
jgi:hypothetical protein